MKIIHSVFITLVVLFYSSSVFSQDINWRSLEGNSNHVVALHVGADYSSYYGLSYGYHLKNNLLPIVVGTELNVSFGGDVLDDWKSRTSIQAELWHSNNFSWSVKGGFILRHFKSEIATLTNLGTDVTTLFGYSHRTWGISAMVNYDRAIATNIKNDLLKEYYPGIRDGWYGATGGNFKCGIRAHRAIKTWTIYLTMGKTFGQNFEDNPTLPFFAELAIQKQF